VRVPVRGSEVPGPFRRSTGFRGSDVPDVPAFACVAQKPSERVSLTHDAESAAIREPTANGAIASSIHT
jgi:hypothetical protein